MALLAELIQQTVKQFATQAEHDNIALTFQPPKGIPNVKFESNAISHDVTHLLNHLFSFTPEFGEINLAFVLKENNNWVLSVSNSGIDLHAYTGVLKGFLLPAQVFKQGPNGTRFEIQLGKALNGSVVETVPQKNLSDNNFYLEIQHRLRSHFNKTENLLDALKSNPIEAAFLTRVNRIIHENMSNVKFDVNRLAELMNMSRTQLFRRLKPIIRQSASGYIRSLRLQKAKQLLETTEHRVSEVAYMTGFETPSNFTKVFVKAFGMKPSSISRYKPPETNGQKNAT
ncbi:MAG: helix-turn-helix transcriptional regulator [Cyclobacteriaceae bacterium]|nr:helix-turn-helix transcriptional regulator [Cyclobacteriaceae bacterium]